MRVLLTKYLDTPQVVIKVQLDAYSRQVRNEATILGRLDGVEGVPRLRFFGVTEDGQDVLITEPVGVSLHKFRISFVCC